MSRHDGKRHEVASHELQATQPDASVMAARQEKI